MNYLIALIALCLPIEAYAYLDPASGSAILYIILAAITSLIFYSKTIFIILYSKLYRLLKKEDPKSYDFVIYSEGKQYWTTFKPLIEEFEKNKQEVLYTTSSQDDPIFNFKSDFIHSKYIGSEVFASSYLNYLRTKVLITTTPQLNIFNLKKSKYVNHYTHIVHAPVDVHTYRKFAFDYYDSVMCSGAHQIKSIRSLESFRNMPQKDLYETGLLYYDNQKELPRDLSDKKTILIAPTWKEYSLLNTCGEVLITELLKNFNVILRPHPQTYKSFPEVISNIENNFLHKENFEIDTNKSGLEVMQKASLMISDLSGVVWDFIFLHEKPVVLFETPDDLKGFEDTEIKHESWEKDLIKKELKTFNELDIHKIEKIIINSRDNWNKEHFRDVKHQSMFNFQNAAPIAYKNLIQIKNHIQGISNG